MTAVHPSQPGYVPARLIAAASAHHGRHKAGTWSPFEERHVAMLQSEAGVLGAVHRGELTDSDLVLLEDLDFELPCEVTYRGGERHCDHGAVWAVTGRSHCTGKPPHTAFICADHFDYLMSGGVWRCRTCGEGCTHRDTIIRTERIKP